MNNKEWKELIEKEAESHGVAVAKHIFERTPATNIFGEPRVFDERSDFTAKSAFRFGTRFVEDNLEQHPKVQILIKALEKYEFNPTEGWVPMGFDPSYEAKEALHNFRSNK